MIGQEIRRRVGIAWHADLIKNSSKNKFLTILKNYVIYYLIYLDIYLKFATKRNLFSMNYLWGNYRFIDKNTIVVISEFDEITPSKNIYLDMVKSGKNKNIIWLKGSTHGDLFMTNNYLDYLNQINRFIKIS